MNAMNDNKLERPASLAEEVAAAIRDAIIEGEFAFGESLSEARLSSWLGVSKTPIREALSVLGKEGLIETFPHRGAFVFSLTYEDIKQLCDFRIKLETLALESSLAHRSDQLKVELAEICSKMRQVHDEENFKEYVKLDHKFHDVFFNNCENKYFVQAYDLVNGKVAAIRTHLSKGHLRTNLSLVEHEEICAALIDGRTSTARAILKRQILRGVKTYRELVSDDDRGGR